MPSDFITTLAPAELVIPPPLPPPPPPLLAEAAEGVIVAVAEPDMVAEARIRSPVNPAALTCQVPLAVAEVTAVVEAKGVTFTATQVAPPSPVASNEMVPVHVPESVKVAPPLSSGRLTIRQLASSTQVVPLVVITLLAAHEGMAHRAMNSSTVDRRFIIPPKNLCPMMPSPLSSL